MRDGSGRRDRLAAAERLAEHRQQPAWVSLHHGGGVGMGFSQHSGMVVVMRRHRQPPKRIARAPTNDRRDAACLGVIAIDCAKEQG